MCMQHIVCNMNCWGHATTNNIHPTIDERLKNNEELVYEIVQKSGKALQYVGEEVRSNRRVVLAAVRQDGMAIQYSTLWNDEEIVAEAIEQNPDVIDWIDSLHE